MHQQATIACFCIAFFLSGTLIAPAAQPAYKEIKSANDPTVHVVENVSYIAQPERNYCYYACLTMILNHMRLNTSLDEVLFFDGVGYTHTTNTASRLPQPGIYYNNFFDLFGVQEAMWTTDITNQSSDENWTEYCTRLQNNISNDHPLITNVDPFSLPSLRSQFAVDNQTWSTLFPSSIHVILLIGFNLTNQSVCYQDANAGYYGESRYGDHAWMTYTQLRSAVENCIIHMYRLGNLTQTTPPLPRNEAAAIALQRNLEVLNGTWNPKFGLNATQQLYQWYTSENMTKTLGLYEAQGGPSHYVLFIRFLRILCSLLRPLRPNVFDIISLAPHDPFGDLVAAKNHVADYLEARENLSWGMHQAELLRNEAQSWEKLSSSYQVFLRRGTYLHDATGEKILESMAKITANILSLEHEIVEPV
ncbi:MAG TPA: hypothetical protein HA260_00365 [Thermoplasmata archaeon]|nr:hypothetical protein [Thermoplasmata archaeon]